MSAMFTENSYQQHSLSHAFEPGVYLLEDAADIAPEQLEGAGSAQIAPVPEKGQLSSMCHFIDAKLLLADLSPEMIARHMGMSRAKLYRLAQPLGGIQRFVRNRRLQYAASLIARDAAAAQSISNLAYELGFGSENTFRRAFKEMFGVTPTAARSEARLALR